MIARPDKEAIPRMRPNSQKIYIMQEVISFHFKLCGGEKPDKSSRTRCRHEADTKKKMAGAVTLFPSLPGSLPFTKLSKSS